MRVTYEFRLPSRTRRVVYEGSLAVALLAGSDVESRFHGPSRRATT